MKVWVRPPMEEAPIIAALLRFSARCSLRLLREVGDMLFSGTGGIWSEGATTICSRGSTLVLVALTPSTGARVTPSTGARVTPRGRGRGVAIGEQLDVPDGVAKASDGCTCTAGSTDDGAFILVKGVVRGWTWGALRRVGVWCV
jgi:hypothetical protein